MRIKGDCVVKHTLDSRLERESSWINKSSTIVACDKILTENWNTDKFFIPTSENTFNLDYSRRTELYKAKKATKQCIQEQTLQLWNSKVEKLTMQGDLSQLLIEEKENISCKKHAQGCPLLCPQQWNKHSFDTINLRRWGKRLVSMFPLCSNQGTLENILNFCSVSLKQGRFTWRHITVLNHLTRNMIEN